MKFDKRPVLIRDNKQDKANRVMFKAYAFRAKIEVEYKQKLTKYLRKG